MDFWGDLQLWVAQLRRHKAISLQARPYWVVRFLLPRVSFSGVLSALLFSSQLPAPNQKNTFISGTSILA